MEVGAKTVEKYWSVYMLRCADGSLYTGVTTDPARRVAEHNGDRAGKGARYTRVRRPVQLVWQEFGHDRSSALKREYALKKLRKADKEQLIKTYMSSIGDM
ncbi:GIY-YIG nuclease family protein [Marinobacterium sediminicola]|uniref:Endonuclease n=1 Tax=Marinobacterium sediminicola TaxID=518898 RepID=A0ABY1RWF8_9GAMM|nr:GIY-YIG nuclease family protein [Marinobacterium sediminicola]ULG70335.1 GIY-YIG nuclease family protein [Marinobacterium sediminicola]SMR69701.1 putative endonuclease [Marinobacterium sediminicola]